ncbi:MAG TPA: sarcosine oxidase subunit gamma family protein [Hyphomicrobiaceae bacterium]|nr:sarcosine oxidase subunit gamma family protein [Hyphomicrobiaceae bacterium]
MSVPSPTTALDVSPLAPFWRPGRRGADVAAPGITIAEPRYAYAQLIARRGTGTRLVEGIRSTLGLALPEPCRATRSRDVRALDIGPGNWLIAAPRHADAELQRMLRSAAGDAGSVISQSHGKVTLAISGPATRDCLAKGCRIDLHPRVFLPGHVAVTPIGPVNAIVAALEPAGSFELIVPSSVAAAFLEWLDTSAAEFGVALA